MGVITYFLLCGYTPFDKKTLKEEAIAICEGRYSFQPKEFWQNVSKDGRNFVRALLTAKPTRRPTATRALQHAWLASHGPLFNSNPSRLMGGSTYQLSSTRGGAKNTCSYRLPTVECLISLISHQNCHPLLLIQSVNTIRLMQLLRSGSAARARSKLASIVTPRRAPRVRVSRRV